MNFNKDDLFNCNVLISDEHWCKKGNSFILHKANLSEYRIEEGSGNLLSNGYIAFFAAGIGYAPETVLVRPDKEITVGQWVTMGYEDYMVEMLF